MGRRVSPSVKSGKRRSLNRTICPNGPSILLLTDFKKGGGVSIRSYIFFYWFHRLPFFISQLGFFLTVFYNLPYVHASVI